MKQWVEFTYLLKNSYMSVQKDSVVKVNGELYLVKRIDQVILLDEACGHPNTVRISARGIKQEGLDG